MPIFTQENRHIKITTPLGTDKLLVAGLSGREEISSLFRYDLSLFSETQAILFSDIVGKGVSVSVELASGELRYFNGIISSFSQLTGESTSGDDTTRVALYRATLVPKLWLLTRSTDIRIFQNKTVPEIVEDVLKRLAITDYQLKLQKTDYERREYCVQYRETHFNFISRLLESEGIFYFFEHKNDSHKLIIADSAQYNVICPGQATASYQYEADTKNDIIFSIEKIQTIMPSEYTLKDYNYEKPNNSLKSHDPGKIVLVPGNREVYDYPGGFRDKTPGDELVKVRMQEEESQITLIRGSGRCRAFASGYKFKLLNVDRSDMNDKEFILTCVSHTITQSVESGGEFSYRNTFSCIPADIPFRPPRVTLKPVVQGAQTAFVVGPKGEEIHTDKLGRVKVQFHWDRLGNTDDNSSCWIRVSQIWAGTGWGGLHIPRIGQEVIVDFLEGDPDFPIIIGRVYNGINVPPTDLPDNKDYTIVKSNTTPGGGGFNGINFIDTKDKEHFDIHAQRDMCTKVLKKQIDWIGTQRHKIVVEEQREMIERDKHLIVKGDLKEKVEGSVSLTAGDVHWGLGGVFAVKADGEIHLKAGPKLVIEAGIITLKGGGGHVHIDASGVSVKGTGTVTVDGGTTFIKGNMVMINSGGSATGPESGCGAQPDAPKEPESLVADVAGQTDAPRQAEPASAAPLGPQAAAFKDAAASGKPFCAT